MLTIYSKPNCSYCEKAKSLLLSKGLQFNIINLDVGQIKEENSSYISKTELLQIIPNARTMPQIIKNGEVIGGYTELAKMIG